MTYTLIIIGVIKTIIGGVAVISIINSPSLLNPVIVGAAVGLAVGSGIEDIFTGCRGLS